MKMRLTKPRKVPVICIFTGYISFYLTVLLVSKFAIVILPDGSYTRNSTFTTILEIFFIMSLGIGYFLLRNMPKKEILWSATIPLVMQLVLQVVQLIALDTTLDIQLVLCLTTQQSGLVKKEI